MTRSPEQKPNQVEVHHPATPPPPQEDYFTQTVKRPERKNQETVIDIREGRLTA